MSTAAELIERARQLRKEADKLEAQVEQAKKEEHLENVAKVLNLMNSTGVTIEDLKNPPKVKITRQKKGKLPAKYADGQGNEWSGKGPTPQWLKNAAAAGKKLDDYRI